MSQLTINATEWRSAQWAKEKGLYAEIYDNIEELDKQIDVLLKKLANSNPESMKLLKSIFWKGTENWDSLLKDRASISGELVLSDFTIKAINSFKNKK